MKKEDKRILKSVNVDVKKNKFLHGKLYNEGTLYDCGKIDLFKN